MWLQARREIGLDAAVDGTLLPAACDDGSFGAARMATSDIGRWEKAILLKLGLREALAEHFGTHSAKATLLSWAAKAYLSPHHRRLLGSHVDRDEKSMLTYARDALAGPLSKLGAILQAVRQRRFHPDESRSGRWAPAQFSAQALQQCDDSTEDEMGVVEESEANKAGSEEDMVGEADSDLPDFSPERDLTAEGSGETPAKLTTVEGKQQPSTGTPRPLPEVDAEASPTGVVVCAGCGARDEEDLHQCLTCYE